MCKTCSKRIKVIDNEQSGTDAEENDVDTYIEPKELSEKIDNQLKGYGLSPIKRKSKSPKHKMLERKRKLDQARSQLDNLAKQMEEIYSSSSYFNIETKLEEKTKKKSQ